MTHKYKYNERVNIWLDDRRVLHASVELPGEGSYEGAYLIAKHAMTDDLLERGYLLQGIRLVSADHGAESTVFHYTESD